MFKEPVLLLIDHLQLKVQIEMKEFKID
jgi:hypothetical protein